MQIGRNACWLDDAKGLPCARQLCAKPALFTPPSYVPALSCLQSLCPAVLERFKEKNIVMSKAAEESLRTLAKYCFTLADVADDVAAALDHKNPKGEGCSCRGSAVITVL